MASAVAVVFVLDTNILDQLQNRSDTRVAFILGTLQELDATLRKWGSRLIVLTGRPEELVPRLVRRLGADGVVSSHDDDPYAIERDRSVRQSLEAIGATWVSVKDHVVFNKDEVLSSIGDPFRVYTPYRNRWLLQLDAGDIAERVTNLANLWPLGAIDDAVGDGRVPSTLEEIGFQTVEPWLKPGEYAAQTRLAEFASRIDEYAVSRDDPALNSTSHLSVDLRFGTVSVRACVQTALAAQSAGSKKWLDELVWREFFHMLLGNFPHVATEPFRSQFRGVHWPGKQEWFSDWKNGATGYPLVDAAMRCLKETGWMHNRLRMVTAMFLTKDLLLDYRLGESWFAETLLDFDLASNNGGWQWSASTGADSQPWFRIFNPVTQSRKFDPSGAFIRRWCPELLELDNDQVHWPHYVSAMEQLTSGLELGTHYPHPIVDHKIQRETALKFLSSVGK